MKRITKKTLEDLEFPQVLRQLEAFCHTDPGRSAVRAMAPYRETASLHQALNRTSEYLASFENDNTIPNHGFEPLDEALGMLRVENSLLPVESFRHMADLAGLIRDHQKFFQKFAEYYPELHAWVSQATFHSIIPERIGSVIDRFGEIRDDASDALQDIRRKMNQAREGINKSFNAALASCQRADYLDEIRESVVENRRVLAVKAMYRRKVKGNVLGTSKTGSIVYIEPEATQRLSRELQLLELDERDEIHRILRALGGVMREYIPDLARYQQIMTEIDLTAAKARYAGKYGGRLPEINEERRHFLKEAYHPLLLLSNRKQGLQTWPQTIELHPENRIIVISGPNAGGKSITLKTIGLLQLMLQSGMLIPVHERSSCSLFGQVLTDIGDNQSIENHLSTYSYRLKNMNRFLRKCDGDTLFLIDEFGTGSDPELGGALAETFLETFYERESYGVITTHYANLKALAGELPHASNANMLFDRKTLEPTFSLEMGQPGSSFTFEVAQKNGIPYSLINKAKKKVSRGKVRFDESIAKLQKERSKMAQTGDRLQEEESKAREEASRLEELNTRLRDKLSSYQELYDYHQRMIHLGTKVDKAAEQYFQNKKKRPLISELLRIVETENSKRKKKTARESEQEKKEKAAIAREAQKEVKAIRKKKEDRKKEAAKKEATRPKPVLKIGDRVRLQDSKAVGSIDSIEKNKAIVNYGQFTTNVSVDQLELVEAARK
ncbi:DNA mismatch repair protein MutS [Robiginitalea sp. SC105]|uniref:endonuclease MutS2 n=1 Tax=Robiginitalea sp. SC105 TaxID=2762332 RepID=UPI001639B391|nr:DNA mismatch repair protein MutS [Robiginitalea sp. SC105]